MANPICIPATILLPAVSDPLPIPITKEWGLIANRAHVANVSQSSGTVRQVLWRTSFWTAQRFDITAIRLVFANIYLDTTGEHAGLNNIFVSAAVEYGTTTVPIFFGGIRETMVAPGAIAVSDDLDILLPRSTQVWTRQIVRTVGTTDKYATGYTTRSDFGEAFTNTSPTANLDAVGTLAGGAQSAMFAPIAILGKTSEKQPPGVAIIGSSVTFGVGENLAIVPSPGDRGYVARLISNRIGQCIIASADETIQQWIAASSLRRSMITAVHPQVAIVELGHADIGIGRSATAIMADLLAMWTQLDSMGIRVFQTTFTPRATSTDGWTTTTGQTPTPTNAVRVLVNDYIRSKPAPLYGIIDTADAVESSRNSGVWKVTGGPWTTDGAYPSRHGDIAAALSPLPIIDAAVQPSPPSKRFDTSSFDLIWSDDFDDVPGALPASHWFFFNAWDDPSSRWRDAYYTDSDAFTDGQSNLTLRLRVEDGKFKTSSIQTYNWSYPESQWIKFSPVREKYFEARCNFSQLKADGPWVSFQLFDPHNPYDGNPANGTEISVMRYVMGGTSFYRNSYNVNNRWGPEDGSWIDCGRFGIDIRDGWHDIGLHWTPSSLTWYLDGDEVWATSNGVSTSTSQALILSVEYEQAPEDPGGFGIQQVVFDDETLLPDYFLVDYIKVYEKKPETPSTSVALVDWIGQESGLEVLNGNPTAQISYNQSLKRTIPAGALSATRMNMYSGDMTYLGYPSWTGAGFSYYMNLFRLSADQNWTTGKTITIEPLTYVAQIGSGTTAAPFGRNTSNVEVDTSWRDRLMWKVGVYIGTDVGSISGADRTAVLATNANVRAVMGPNEIDAPESWRIYYLAPQEAPGGVSTVTSLAQTTITLQKLLTRVVDHMRHTFDAVRAKRPNDVAVLAPSLIQITTVTGSRTFNNYDFMNYTSTTPAIGLGDHAQWCDAYQIHNHISYHQLPNPWTGINPAETAISAYGYWKPKIDIETQRIAQGKDPLRRPVVDGEIGNTTQGDGINIEGRTDIHHLRQTKYGMIPAAKVAWGVCQMYFYTNGNSSATGFNIIARNGLRYISTYSVVSTQRGSGYAVNGVYNLVGLTVSSNPVPRFRVTAVGTGGSVTSVQILEPGNFLGTPASPANLATPSGGAAAAISFTLTTAFANDEPHRSSLGVYDYDVRNAVMDYRKHDIDLGIAIRAKTWQEYDRDWLAWFDMIQAPLAGGPTTCPWREWNFVTFANNLITMNDRTGNRNLVARIVQSKYVVSVNPIVGRPHRFSAEIMLDGSTAARGCLRVRGYDKLNGLRELSSSVVSGISGWVPVSVDFTHNPHNNPRLPDPLTCLLMLDHNGTGRMQVRNPTISPI